MIFLSTTLSARVKGVEDGRRLLVYHAGGCHGLPREGVRSMMMVS